MSKWYKVELTGDQMKEFNDDWDEAIDGEFVSEDRVKFGSYYVDADGNTHSTTEFDMHHGMLFISEKHTYVVKLKNELDAMQLKLRWS